MRQLGFDRLRALKTVKQNISGARSKMTRAAQVLFAKLTFITRMVSFSLFSVTLTALTLSSCATFTKPVSPTTTIADSTNVPRHYHEAIDLSGRLSVRYQQDGKEQALHGSFTWSQSSQNTLVTILSPLGQTLATIDITPQQSTLQQAGQPARTAADVDLLTAQALGWPLPIAGLRDWLQGFGSGANGKPFNLNPTVDNGATTVTTADHWSIQYDSWQSVKGTSTKTSSPQTSIFPKRIDLTRSTAQAGDVAIRIVIDSAQPH